jgi:hypothetical protein
MNKFSTITDKIKALALAAKINIQTPVDKQSPITPIEPEK